MHETAQAAEPRPLWRRITGSTVFHLIAAFVVFGLLLNFVAKPYLIPSGSMEHTLEVGDRVLVNRLAYVGSEPKTGDVVVFDAAEAWDGVRTSTDGPVKAALRWLGEVSGFGPSSPHTLVKRVIGVPGATVSCCNNSGAVIVDGEPLDEPYIYDNQQFEQGVLDCTTSPRSQRCFSEVVVPEDKYLMLGDHRGNSSDSASACRGDRNPSGDIGCWRWAERDEIVGKAAVVLWPISRWSKVQ